TAEGLDSPAVKLHEPAHQGKADAEAALSVIDPPLALRRQVEHVRKKLGRNPDSRVRDADDGKSLLARDPNPDGPAGRGVPDRVRQQIRDDLVEPHRVRVRPDGLGPNIDDVALEPSRARPAAPRAPHACRQAQWL